MLNRIPHEEGICIWKLVSHQIEVHESHVVKVAVLPPIGENDRSNDICSGILQRREGLEVRLPVAVARRSIEEGLDVKFPNSIVNELSDAS
jgi:hypothetical protein